MPAVYPLRTRSTGHAAGVLCAAAIIVLLLTPRTAYADWQYTKWGMSPEEVVAASNGNAQLLPDTEAKKSRATDNDFITLAKAVRSVNGERFSVSFNFIKHSKRLQMVSLDAVDVSRCTMYKSYLFHRYGAPAVSEFDGTLLIWRDPPSGNAVDWVYSPPEFCTIRIEPINSDFANSM
jgi:hypothetical protein